MKRLLLAGTLSLILVLAVIALSCGGTSTATTPITTLPTVTQSTATVTAPATTETPMPVDNVQVEIKGLSFIPSAVTIPIGTTVTWVNLDSVQHTVTSRNDLFDSGMINQNGTFSYLFTVPGEYEYYCIPHPFMTGKVIVE